MARVDADALSFQDFIDRYVLPGVPVVLTSARTASKLGLQPWDAQRFREACPEARIRATSHNATSLAWGGLGTLEGFTLPELFSAWSAASRRRTSEGPLYGVDLDPLCRRVDS